MNIYIINRSQESEVRRQSTEARSQKPKILFLFCLLSALFHLSSAVYGAEEKRVVNEDIGIMVASITEEYKQDLNLDNSNGVIVLGVLPGGPADEGGIHPGDIILGIANTAINNLDEYEEAIKKLEGRADFNIMIRTRDGSFSFIQIISREE